MTTTDYRTLPAGRELDVLVAERVMGLKRLPDVKGLPVFESASGPHLYSDVLAQCGSFTLQYDPPPTLPRYSTNIAAAWSVVDVIASHGLRWWFSGPRDDGRWLAAIREHAATDTVASSEGDALALAICRASLKFSELHP